MRRNYVIGRPLFRKRIIRFFSRAVEAARKNLTRVNSRRTFDSTTRFGSTETSLRPVARPALRPGSTLRKKESFSTFSRQRLTCCCDRVRNVPFLPRSLRRVGERQRKAPAILSRSITIDPEVLQMNGHCFLFYHRFNTLI